MRSFAVASVLSLALAACGSTARIGEGGIRGPGQAAPGSTDGASGFDVATGDEMRVGAGGRPEGTTSGGGAVGGAAGTDGARPSPGRAPGRSATQPGGSGSAGSGSSGGGGGEAGSAPGTTDTEIYLGVPVLEGRDELNQSVGVAATSGDHRDYVEILTEDLNARGGVAGRKVVPVIHVYDNQSTQTTEQQDQAACATWTEDSRVFAALIHANATPTLFQCLTKAGVAMVANGPITDLDDTDYERYPALATTSAPSLHKVARQMADGLVSLGYYEPEALTGDVTIGLLRFDFPSHKRVTEEALKPALARHGLAVAEEFEVHFARSNSEISQTLAQIQSAVLRFNSAGVDHVLLFDRNAVQLIFFTRFAENQGYRPQYGLNSNSTPETAWAIGAVSEQQVDTAFGVGWYPLMDSAAQFRPDNPNTERCQELMRRNGIEFADESAEAFAHIFCDRFWLTEAAGNAAARPLTLPSFVAGIESLGRRYLPPAGLRAGFGPGQHDGAGEWAPIAFDSDCPCFTYNAQPRPY